MSSSDKEDNIIKSINHDYIFHLYCTKLSIYIFQRYLKVFEVYSS